MNLQRYDALTFDCYGTLIDWESGIVAALRPVLGSAADGLSDDQLLELHARHETAAEGDDEGYLPYREVLGRVLEGIAAEVGHRLVAGQRAALADSVGAWPAFDDTVSALRRLGARYRLGILSNIDDELFAATRPRLGVSLDWVVTAQQVGSYKPSLRNFAVLLERLDVPPASVLHVAQSLFHDIEPARRMGLATVWVNRRAGRQGGGATPPAEATADLVVPDLATLAELAEC